MMENLKFLCRISRNVWKLQKESIKSRELSKLEWTVSAAKNAKLSLPSLYPKSLLPSIYHFQAVRRTYSTDDSQPKKLQLMDFSPIAWPSLVKTIKNWVYTTFIVRPYLDPDFSMGEFVEGAKRATEIVSSNLAEGKLDELNGLVSPECIAEVKKNMATLNAKQRHELSIKKEDIYFSFPYELGIIFDEQKKTSDDNPGRYVEITVVHHVLRGHKEMVERGEVVPLDVGVNSEFKDKIFILNYRYIRNYTKGISDQWTINVINHFKPTEF